MQRILEPELMTDRKRVQAYASADFSDSITEYLDGLRKAFPSANYFLDLGCGPGDAAIGLAKKNPNSIIFALDGSHEMMKLVEEQSYHDPNIRPSQIIRITERFQDYDCWANKLVDVVMSKDLLHHLEDPMELWNWVKDKTKTGTGQHHMDLINPGSKSAAKAIVEKYAATSHPYVKEDFYYSLLAAHTIEKVEQQLKDVGLDLRVSRAKSGRHMIIQGKR